MDHADRRYLPVNTAARFARPAESAQAPRTAASASAEPVTIEPTDASVYKASQVIYASQPELRLHGKGGPCFVHPKMVHHLSRSPPQKAWTGKAQPPVATRGPMKALPPVCRPFIPAATKLSPPICPETHPQPTPPLADHPCTDVADLLFDSDEECLELQHPLQRRPMIPPTPKQGSAASAQLGGNLAPPPPKQLPAGRIVQTAGSAYPAGSAPMAEAGHDPAGFYDNPHSWIYIPPHGI